MVQTNNSQATKKLSALVRDFSIRSGGRKVFRGCPAEYSAAVNAIRDRVRTRPPRPADDRAAGSGTGLPIG